MVQGAKWTYPATKESSQDYGHNHGHQRPQKAPVERLGAEHASHCDQGIKLKEPVDRPAPQLPPLHPYSCDNAEPDKQQEEEDLRYASDRYYSHCSIVLIVEIIKIIRVVMSRLESRSHRSVSMWESVTPVVCPLTSAAAFCPLPPSLCYLLAVSC
jgi:hypothetical protein